MAAFKVLVVDDDEISITIMKIIFNINFPDVKLDHFRSGNEGLEYLKKGNTPNVIFLDVNMPRINGIEFLEKLPKPNKYVICAMTANYKKETQEKMKALGCEYFIEKPLSPKYIGEVLESVSKS